MAAADRIDANTPRLTLVGAAATAAWMTTELGEKMLGYYLEAGSDACRLG
jgi:hypothetical protein